MKNNKILIGIALLTLVTTGCKTFEPDPEIVEKARILNEEGRIEIEGVEYSAVEGFITHSKGEIFYSLGPLGKTLYGRDEYIDFLEVPNDLDYTVLITEHAGSPFYVQTEKKESFINEVNRNASAWVCSYTNPNDIYNMKFEKLDNDKCDLMNSKYHDLKAYSESENTKDQETINVESKQHALYNFHKYTSDQSIGLADSLIQILKVEDSYRLVIESTDNINNYVCYKFDEELNSFFSTILGDIK